MTFAVIVLLFVGFLLIDLAVRKASQRIAHKRERREREAVLHESLRLDFTAEAPSLKRVSVDKPRARILAVDDEAVVLDSFRKILVLAGYDVDTVESGPEALGLIQRHDYDFVFTDLKMPEMDGVEVVKAVAHLRPDIDVAVITGYATITSAVETMQHGAIDYVEKPFTEEELVEFVRRLVIKREARLEAQKKPVVRLTTPAIAEAVAGNEYCLPGGAFISDGHAWARIEPSGQVRIGMDDFARKALHTIEDLESPPLDHQVKRGAPLFAAHHGSGHAVFFAPVSGKVIDVNDELAIDPECVTQSPYDRGWICLIEPADLMADLQTLRVGRAAVTWYQEEIDRLQQQLHPEAAGVGDEHWSEFEQGFLKPRLAHAS